MTCITSDQKTQIEADLAATIAHIAAIDAALSSGALSETKSYKFDSGSGSQQETFNSPLELITLRKSLVATRNLYQRQLRGTNIITQQTRR